MSKRKKLQELTIKDNFMFGAVMADGELCREFLELVLKFPIAKVTVSKEKSFVYHPQYRGVRLDVYAADENQTHYNIEMQVMYRRNLGKRSRYYHSQIDMELLMAGSEYEHLPDSYVIFICDFDPFFQKKYQYTFEMVCREEENASLEDGSKTIFLSTCGENADEVPEELVRFLQYVKAGHTERADESGNGFVQKIKDAVQDIKASREMEERYMLLEELIKEEREEAKAEGKAEGIAEGLAEGKVQERIESILLILSDLGEVPESLRVRIQEEKEPEVLRSYLKKAAAAKTMAEFEKSIEQS